MATTTIPWGDGSGENIYLTYSSASGNQTVTITSDAHTGYNERTKDITFAVAAGQTTITRTLTVKQTGKDFLVVTFNNTAVTHNGVAVGYEQ